ncbi:Heterokaryon incompatibility protein 6, OR allele [Pseudocercospora fuligena]|uniref:Heterokaryon incompatibility protein 6, OR allele n=1 Tax=Pseudocercospora fuligena TaxID=685502 RepID=A0A8H6VHQ8_9PEZI|nr:Heterokaryon incompatibility protein 6, OR allele [Pseudocercospora fuligena]
MARKRRIYDPLSKNEFRVLILKPGRHEDPIRCKLKVHSLDEQPLIPYETISYVWGDPRAQRRIFLNGRAVYVPISTKQAMKDMRLPTERRRLWIDAICVNQKGLDERSQQVALMGRIYSCGIRNLIYLGNGPGIVAKAIFDVIEAATIKLSTAIILESDGVQEDWTYERWKPKSWKASSPLIEADVTPLEQLFERPWFTRLWVMQEACLAKENFVCFGNMHGDFQQLLDICLATGVASSYWSWSEKAKKGFDTLFWMQYIIHSLQLAHENFDIHDVLHLAQRLVTKERHDRVFAVRDMLLVNCESHEISNLLAVDYRKPIGAVFKDATIYALMTSRTDKILNEICHREEADMFADGRSSWTAPWDRQQDYRKSSSIFDWENGFAGWFSPDQKQRLEVGTAQANSVLAVSSLVLDEASEVTAPVSVSIGTFQML